MENSIVAALAAEANSASKDGEAKRRLIQRVRRLTGHEDGVFAVAIDGEDVVSCALTGNKQSVQVWNFHHALASSPKGMIWSITIAALGCADESLPDGAFAGIANQILLGGLRGLDAALDVFLSVSPVDHDKLFVCHHVVNNPASAPLVSLLVLFLGQDFVDLVDPYTDRTVYECSAKQVKRAIDERLQFLGRFKVLEPSIHQSATSKANTVLDTSQEGAPAAVMKFFRDKTQYEREIAARLCGDVGGSLDPKYVVGIKETSDELGAGRFKAEARERKLFDHGILMEAGKHCIQRSPTMKTPQG